jgi:thiol-disulfide isomerase/thioredoxin
MWHCRSVSIGGWSGLAVAVGVLVGATLLGLWRRRRDGQLRPAAGAEASSDPVLDDLTDLGVRAGTPVTLLQFSSAFCAPCRIARRICAEVAAQFDGVAHVEVDAESHLDAVRRLDIWRTPTVLVIDGTGRVVHRATGAPSKAQVIAAIAPMLPVAA